MRAALMGATFAAQVGPMALLCMRRTLGSGWRAGMVVGAGIATADALYAALAASRLAGISKFLATNAQIVHLIAAAVMIVLGLKLLLTNDVAEPGSLATGGRYFETVFLTLTNPMTIVAYGAAIGLLAPLAHFDFGFAFSTVLGVFAGSLVWWIILVSVVARFRRLLSGSARRVVDKVSALSLIGFGVKTATIR